uniref:Major facilitator superfamily (MFS) profile domain-containing protein n=1 Tax=Meloidogyne incognita TaxID=6306 RepID=A0A914N6I5_MELIC
MDSHIIPSINSPILKTNWKSIYIVAIVAFITSLEYAATNDWNYFCQLDPSATITFYGILRTVGGLSGGISTILAGWLCNRWKDTRQVLIISKLSILLSTLFFLASELVKGFAFNAFFLCYKFFMGIASGGGSMSRTHVAMASTEKDRDKAIAITSLLPAVGLLVGFGKKKIF